MNMILAASAITLWLNPLPAPQMPAPTMPFSYIQAQEVAAPVVIPIVHCAFDGTDEKWSEYNHTCHADPAERGPAPFPPEHSCLAACNVIQKVIRP